MRPAGERSGSRNGGRRAEPRRANPQRFTGVPPRQGQQKGGDRTGEEVAETGSWRGDAGANRDLGSRPRAEIQLAQRQAVEAGRSVPFSRWIGGPITEEG